MDSNEIENNHLVELGDSDYEIVDGEPDIIGWDVKNEQGEKIGEVDELLFDKETRKVRYIIVDLDDNELELDEDKKVLIPIGIVDIYSEEEAEEEEDEEEGSEDDEASEENESVLEKDDDGVNDFDEDEEDETLLRDHAADTEIDEDDDDENEIYEPAEDGDVVIVPVSIEKLKQLPAYEKDNVTAESESEIRRIFEGGLSETSPAVPYNRKDFYAHEHFNDNKFYDRTEESGILMPASAESTEPKIGKTGVGFGEPEDHQAETFEKDRSDLQLPGTDEEEGLTGSEHEKPVF